MIEQRIGEHILTSGN